MVVIAIIAILAALLLPSLKTARAAAQRTACLNNQHQLGVAYQLYADTYSDFLPIGYANNTKQLTHYMNWNNANYQHIMFSASLFYGNFVSTPQVFFCPAQRNPGFLYKAPTNPWPPVLSPSPTNVSTRSGYNCRPTVNWGAAPAIVMPAGLPRMKDLAKQAVFSDMIATPAYVAPNGHWTGVNVSYGDGSGKFILWDRFEADLASIPNSPATTSPIYNSMIDSIWQDFDLAY